MMKLKYKNTVVTGASSGIGAEVAKYLARNNCHVLAVARSYKNLQTQKMSLNKKYQKFFHIQVADINKETAREDIISKALKRGSIDLFVNNAGIGVARPFVDMDDNNIGRVMNTNLNSPIRLTKKLLDSYMRNGKEAKLQIIFVTSLAGKMGFPNLSTYSATKFGMEGFAEALRHDLRGTNVSICILRPGVTDTNFFQSAGMEEFYSSVKEKSVLHSPESVSELLFNRLTPRLEELTVGTDKYAIKLLPFFGWKRRLKVLDLLNKL